jgi:hypothetical protein
MIPIQHKLNQKYQIQLFYLIPANQHHQPSNQSTILITNKNLEINKLFLLIYSKKINLILNFHPLSVLQEMIFQQINTTMLRYLFHNLKKHKLSISNQLQVQNMQKVPTNSKNNQKQQWQSNTKIKSKIKSIECDSYLLLISTNNSYFIYIYLVT